MVKLMYFPASLAQNFVEYLFHSCHCTAPVSSNGPRLAIPDAGDEVSANLKPGPPSGAFTALPGSAR